MESNNKLKEINIKNCMCYYFNDKNKFEDFDIDNIIIDENHRERFWFSTFHAKLWRCIY